MPRITGTSHIDLTVSNLDRSIDFYTRLLSMTQLARMRVEENSFEVAYLADGTGMILGLVQHDSGNSAPFSPRVTGLDHLSFAVAAPGDLHAWAKELDTQGISHTGVTDQAPIGSGLNFEDPDGIALEFYYINPSVVPAR